MNVVSAATKYAKDYDDILDLVRELEFSFEYQT